MRVAYKIHKTGTPKIANDRGRLVPAGLWWHGAEWGGTDNALIYDTKTTAQPLPTYGDWEWVEIYLNETTEGNN